MWEHRGKIAVVGLGHSKVLRNDDGKPEHVLGALAVDAATKAIADAGLKPQDIDGVCTAPDAPFEGASHEDGVGEVSPAYLEAHMKGQGLTNVQWTEAMHSPTNPRMIGHALVNAFEVVGSGRAKAVLVVRALNNPSGIKYGQGGANVEAQVKGPAQFSVPYGQSGPASFSFVASRYLWKYNQPREKMATFAIHERKYGLMYEDGYWYQNRPQPLTQEDYLTSRMIATPQCIYDCDIPVQGAAAFVVTSAERARSLKQPPVYILGYGVTGGGQRSTLAKVEDQEALAAEMERQLRTSSGLAPKDASLVNVYDGYIYIAPFWVEGLGLCKPGEFLDFIQEGRIEADGKKPLNVCSGNIGAGRMHGVPHNYDAVLQLRGQSNKRQVKGASTAVAVVGPQGLGQGIVYSKTPNP